MAFTQFDPARRPVLAGPLNGYGLRFNASAGVTPQHLVADIPAGLAGAAAFTFSGWFYRELSLTTYDAFPTLFGIVPPGGSSTTGAGFCQGGNGLAFTTTGTAAPSSPSATTANAFPGFTWVHLAGVRGADGIGRLYRDGVQIASGGMGAMGTDLSGMDLVLGASRTGERPVEMRASNLQVWNIALTPAQIAGWAMPRLLAPFPAGLLFYAPI